MRPPTNNLLLRRLLRRLLRDPPRIEEAGEQITARDHPTDRPITVDADELPDVRVREALYRGADRIGRRACVQPHGHRRQRAQGLLYRRREVVHV